MDFFLAGRSDYRIDYRSFGRCGAVLLRQMRSTDAGVMARSDAPIGCVWVQSCRAVVFQCGLAWNLLLLLDAELESRIDPINRSSATTGRWLLLDVE